jgi:uncharacterized protein (DUF302 family)
MEYGHTVEYSGGVDEAVETVEEKLKEHGFGVLVDLDIQQKLDEKIGAEIDEYRILGACSPRHAYEAIQEEQEIGLLLPCNVIVYRDDGQTYASSVEPEEVLDVTGNEDLEDVAQEVGDGLRSALDEI